MPASLRTAHLIAFGVPAALLGGAYVGQYGFDLYPCEMCLWQRWPHFAALALAFVALFVPPRRILIGLAATAIAVSGVIGGFHAGVEYGWWEGLTGCTSLPSAEGGSALDSVMNAPMVRCDRAPWDLFGVSLAGWNFLISSVAALAILTLLARTRHAQV